MAHSEACQLFIEEQIEEGLAAGKTPHSIGKELTAMIQKYFEANIPVNTLKARAYRMQKGHDANASNPPTPANHDEIPEKRSNQRLINAEGRIKKGTAPGPGRAPKYSVAAPMTRNRPPKHPQPISDALHWATVAISQLSRITDEDPKREEGLLKVLHWIQKQLKKGGWSNENSGNQ